MNLETDPKIPAGFWPRVGAKFFDWLLITAIQVFVLGLIAVFDSVGGVTTALLDIVLFLVCAFIGIVYIAWGNANGRATLGYRLAGLKLERITGEPLSFGRSLVRTLLWASAYLVFVYGGFLNFLWIVFDRKKRAGHDLVCQTRVVTIGKPRLILLGSSIIASLVFLILWVSDIIFPSPLRAFYIPAGSMEPTLQIDDRFLSNLLIYRFRNPQNGEIAIFKAPKAALSHSTLSGDVDFVKRVVGVPNDTVWIVNRQLYRNGVKNKEPYVQWDDPQNPANSGMFSYSYDLKIVDGKVYSREYIGPNEPGFWAENGVLVPQAQQQSISRAQPEKVPQNCYLMLGDNRSNSNDSHVWGFAPREAFQARALVIFWPLKRWRMIQN